MSAYIIPFIIVSLIAYSCVKKQNAYNSFVDGAKTSFDLVLTGLPYIVAIFIAIEIFQVSHLSSLFANCISPFFGVFGIPKELSELIILKNFSGCGSLAILESIFDNYGVDSYIARAGCCVASCSEAIFYIVAVYFSKTKVQKFRYAIIIGILANFIGAIFGCFICRFI